MTNPGGSEVDNAISAHWQTQEFEQRLKQVESLLFGNQKLGVKSLVQVIHDLDDRIQGLSAQLEIHQQHAQTEEKRALARQARAEAQHTWILAALWLSAISSIVLLARVTFS